MKLGSIFAAAVRRIFNRSSQVSVARQAEPAIQPGRAGIDREDIKAAIRKRGWTMERLSSSWGYRENAISLMLGRPWPAVQQRVADFLGYTHPREIWPARYYPDGNPKPRAAAIKAERERAGRVGRAA